MDYCRREREREGKENLVNTTLDLIKITCTEEKEREGESGKIE